MKLLNTISVRLAAFSVFRGEIAGRTRAVETPYLFQYSLSCHTTFAKQPSMGKQKFSAGLNVAYGMSTEHIYLSIPRNITVWNTRMV
jgi:hypothetical protein